MWSFKSAPSPHLPRRLVASRPINRHVIKRRPRSMPLHTTRMLRHQEHDMPSKVMVYNRGFMGRRFFSWVLYSVAAISMFRFVASKLTELDEATGELETSDTKGEEEDSVFIALKYPKKLPKKFYKSSDPDWQEFIDMNKNEKRSKAIQRELATYVQNGISKDSRLKPVLGKNIKLSRYWLDFKYPDGPPPEYSRMGIEISEEHLALSTQVIPHSYYVQLSNFLWPRAIFHALYLSLGITGAAQKIKLKSRFGLELNETERQVELLYAAESKIRKVVNVRNKDSLQTRLEQQLKEAKSGTKSSTTGALPASPPTKSSSTDPTSSISSIWRALKWTKSSPSENSVTSSSILSWLPSAPLPPYEHLIKPLTDSQDLRMAHKMFLSHFSQHSQKSKTDVMPKGAFFITGEVEIKGDRARCKVRVIAAYNPKLAKFLYIHNAVTDIWPHIQTAKGD